MPQMTCTNHPESDGSIVRCSRCLRPFCSDCLIRLGGRPFCGDCKVEHVVDVHSGVPATSLELASVGRRFAALMIDQLIVVGVMLVLVLISIPFVDKNAVFAVFFVVAMLVGFAFAILYEPLFLARTGQTPGKRAMHIRVVRNDGSAISRGQAWGRALGRFAAGMVLSVFEYLPAFFTNERQTIHDMIAGTRVVRVA